jgi:hypothetical protein
MYTFVGKPQNQTAAAATLLKSTQQRESIRSAAALNSLETIRRSTHARG